MAGSCSGEAILSHSSSDRLWIGFQRGARYPRTLGERLQLAKSPSQKVDFRLLPYPGVETPVTIITGVRRSIIKPGVCIDHPTLFGNLRGWANARPG
jgi:hypothetical protein